MLPRYTSSTDNWVVEIAMETLVANMAEYVLRSTIMEWGSKVKVARPAVVVLQKYFVHYMSCISIYDILSLLNFFIGDIAGQLCDWNGWRYWLHLQVYLMYCQEKLFYDHYVWANSIFSFTTIAKMICNTILIHVNCLDAFLIHPQHALLSLVFMAYHSWSLTCW